jgi:hypothetical protein
MMLSIISVMLLLGTQEPAQTAEPIEAAATAQEAAPVEDDVICRRKYSSDNKFGGRTKSEKVCKTREEWEQDRRKR